MQLLIKIKRRLEWPGIIARYRDGEVLASMCAPPRPIYIFLIILHVAEAVAALKAVKFRRDLGF
jgi:hypothetical protein